MSEQKTIKGKIKAICFKADWSFTDKCESLKKSGYKLEYVDVDDEYFECDKLIIVGERIYEVIEEEDIDGGDIFESSENTDGTISYLVSYYNGGCSHSEAVEEALKKGERDEN